MSPDSSHTRAHSCIHALSNQASSPGSLCEGRLLGHGERVGSVGARAGARQVRGSGDAAARAGPEREFPQPAPAPAPRRPRLLLASPWWSGETRRRCCAGPRAPPSPRRGPRSRRLGAAAGAAAGAAGRPRSRRGGGSPRSRVPPRGGCSPGAWS